MATITATVGFDTIAPANWTGWTSYKGGSQMTVTNGSHTTVLTGKGLTYSWDGRLTGGWVDKIQSFQGEQQLGSLSNFSMYGSTVQSYLTFGDYRGLYHAVQQGNDLIFGSRFADRLAGHEGDDDIQSGGGNDQIYAGDGNDKVTLSAGSTFTDGGAGFDTVYLPGNAVTYLQYRNGEGWDFRKSGIDASMINVERVTFSDGVLAFDTEVNAGMGFRIYQAAFAREPDAGGLGYWIRQLDAGYKNPHSMAADFIYSGEFINKYGTPQTVSNGRYIELLYQNALGRQLDQSGFDYWNAELNSGRRDRSDLLLEFANSAENRAQTAPEISDGIWYV